MPRLRKVIYLILVVAAFAAGCSSLQPDQPPEQEPASTDETQPETSEPDTAPSPTAEPTATSDPFPNPIMTITGEEEIVFDWSNDRCEGENIPDLAARAFRDSADVVHLIISHYVNYQMTGPDLNSVVSDCSSPILTSDYNPDPAFFNDSEWLAAPYTEDGQTVYALVHNEYRGHTHPGQCPSGDYFDCLDTSITLAISTDGGQTYQDAAEAPDHLVAGLPYEALPGEGPFGIRTPSNIIKGPDGYYYSFSNISQYGTQSQWVCLMRTDDLADPTSWRYWDFSGFEGTFVNPYLEPDLKPIDHTCKAVAQNEIGASLNESITFNTYLNRYVLVGNSADQIDGRETWGWYYAFSDDLVHWTKRKLLMEVPLPWTVGNGGSDLSYLYPTLLDPNSESRSFETTGETSYLYVTRMNFGAGSLDRDLIRFPVSFGTE